MKMLKKSKKSLNGNLVKLPNQLMKKILESQNAIENVIVKQMEVSDLV